MMNISRRRFLIVSSVGAGGLLVGVRSADAADERLEAVDLTAWIRIAPDDTVTIAPPHTEIGQAVSTSQTQLIAEELDVAWGKIVIRTPEADPKYGFQFAGGSQTIALTWMPLRQAGAAARAMLIAAASARWNVPERECITENGVIVHPSSGRRLSYGAVALEAAKLPIPDHIPLKDKDSWRYIGKPVPKHETPAIVVGKQVYGMDLHLPGMVVASIERLPTPGAKPRYDASRALKIPGVLKILEIPALPPADHGGGSAANAPTRGGIAVIARDTWTAFMARDALAVQWEEPNAEESSDTLAKSLSAAIAGDGDEYYKSGDLAGALAASDLIGVVADYHQPYLAHMMMEPQNCVVQVEAGRVRCWGPTQDPQSAAAAVADALKIAPDKVAFRAMPAGGGFGRREVNAAVEAALIAARMDGVPVKVVWKREDETRFDQYRPAASARVRVLADRNGMLVGWDHHSASAWGESTTTTDTTTLGRDFLYEAPNCSFRHSTIRSAIEIGAMRGVNSTYNVFAVECAIDEMAAALGQDPLALRLKWLSRHPTFRKTVPPPAGTEGIIEPTEVSHLRMRTALEACANKIGWKYRSETSHGMGLAAYDHLGTHCAVAAEVGLFNNRVHVLRIVAAVDPGIVVNPLGAKAQIEGGLVFGLSGALREQITFKNSKAEQSTYSDYRLVAMPDVPDIEVVLIESGASPTGVGEVGVPGAAPAVANAIFAATGTRIRTLPLFGTKPELDPA